MIPNGMELERVRLVADLRGAIGCPDGLPGEEVA
jgi:hypothetical protein